MPITVRKELPCHGIREQREVQSWAEGLGHVRASKSVWHRVTGSMRTVASGGGTGQEASIQKSRLGDGAGKEARAERGAAQLAGWAEPRYKG